MHAFGGAPGSSALMNPGLEGNSFSTHRSFNSFSGQYLPNSPGELSPTFMPRDPTTGTLETLVTVSKGARVVTLPTTIIFQSASTSENAVLYTSILPLVETGEITTFLKEFVRYPAMPLRQASDLATPHYLHRSSWQTATTTFRFNIGQRYAMERVKEAAGQQELVRDSAQIAMSFQQHIVLLGVDGLKMAHKPLIEQRRSSGKYDTEDVLSASEFQVMHFCAVQKTTSHAWTAYIQATKEIMLRYDGSPTTLVTDVKIKQSFVKDEYTKFMETGEPSLPNVRNPTGTMSRATPVENIVYLSFIPERLASKQSPMHELTQIGGWHPGFDVPNLVNSNDYADKYNNFSRTLQIYDPELDSFVTITLGQMVEHSHMFDEDGKFKSEILNPGVKSDKTETYIADLFGIKNFKDGSGNKSESTMKFHASMFLKSIGSNFARWTNKSISELSKSINDGVELYKQMAKSEFNAKTLQDTLGKTIQKEAPGKSVADLLEAIVDKDIGTLKWHMTNLDCQDIKLDEPLTNVSGFLSWRGFDALYQRYSKQTRSEKDKADREWVILVNFVEAVKQLVSFIVDYLPSCALIKRVRYDPSSPYYKFEKTDEETLCDQLWNFNATFPVLLHKGSFLQFSTAVENPAEIGGLVHSTSFVPPTAAKAAPNVLAFASTTDGKAQTLVLKAIYDRLIQLNFAQHLSTLKKMTNKVTYKKIIEAIGFDAIKPNYGGQESILPSIPVITFDADFFDQAQNKGITMTAGTPADLAQTRKQSVVATVKNLPHVSKYHWLLVNNWTMNALLNYLITVYNMLQKGEPSSDTKIEALSNEFVALLKPVALADATLKRAADADFPADDAEINSDTSAIASTLLTGGKTGQEVYAATKTILGAGFGTAETAKVIPALNTYWMHNFTEDSDQKVYEDRIKDLDAKLLTVLKKYDKNVTLAEAYGESTKQNDIKLGKTKWLSEIPIISKLKEIAENLKTVAKADINNANMVDDLVKKPNDGVITKKLLALLNLGTDANINFGNEPYYGAKTRYPSMYDESYDGKKSKNMQSFDSDVDTWIRTPFRVSCENAQSMLKNNNRILKLEMRIEYVGNEWTEHRVIAGNPFGTGNNAGFEGQKTLLADKETFEVLLSNTRSKSPDDWTWRDLPFLEADKKCQVHLDGISLKVQTERHYHDLLFGIRLYDNEKRLTDAIQNAWDLLKSNNICPSHYDVAVGMTSFLAIWNKRVSDIFIDRNIYYPVDFIIFRPWINLLTVLGFLLRPGVDALGFISTSHADKMSSATAMDKTGIVHCSIWCGVVFNNPANVKKVPNLSCIGFGAGGGSGFYTLDQIRDHMSHKEYTPIQKGTSSPSLISALIPKGSMPKRTMLSLSGYIPDDGHYMEHGLVLNDSERQFKSDSLDSLAHYPTAKYYSEFWNLQASAENVGASLNMDATSSGNNMICHLGTTRFFNPITGGFDYIILNTGHFGADEGPGCKKARMTGSPFPQFNYATDPIYKVITV